MSEVTSVPAELGSLVESIKQLGEYCTALKDGAGGFAYMLPNEWQGPAMGAFIGAFAAWETGARELIQSAADLFEQADLAKKTYESTGEALTTAWNDFSSQLG
ncbi:WXG100 family type VII secretion target [Galactobacter valiniphilus]|uniref:WXG100 family type VII secretion target n=1 Tax=Galactobacter valiniphilus TaxID=2676122 RepID=UPI00373516F5